MTRKFLICDDKVVRQKSYLNDLYDQLIDIKGVKLITDRAQLEELIADYDVIAIHSSVIGSPNDVTQFLRQFMEDKYIILFSGGESDWTYDGKHIMSARVQDFYTERLIDFAKSVCMSEERIELMSLQYGEAYLLPTLMRLNHLYWLVNGDLDELLNTPGYRNWCRICDLKPRDEAFGVELKRKISQEMAKL